MTTDPNRLLTDDDVKAIVTELKSQLVKDFQVEVGKGVLGWVKKALVLLLILAALYGISGTTWFNRAATRALPGDKPTIPAMVGKAAMKVAGVVPKGFTVIPPSETPEDMMAMAEAIEELNRRARQ